MKKYIAFTLAEILVTLMIIGIIAGMTIPGLISNTQNKEAYTKVSRAYSTISNATKIIEAKNGRTRFWNWSEVLSKQYAGILNIAKNCGYGSGCFPSDYKLKNRSGSDNSNKYNDGTWYNFITTDGMYWAAKVNSSCSLSDGTYTKNGCAYFEVDTNGENRPNRIGYDVFGFVVTPDGTFPFGGCPNCDTSDCTSSKSTGWSCTSVMLSNGKVDPIINEPKEGEGEEKTE